MLNDPESLKHKVLMLPVKQTQIRDQAFKAIIIKKL